MPKTITLDGKRIRLSDKLPQNEIKWLVNRMHVSTSESEIESDILSRSKSWPEPQRRQAVAFAIWTHRQNQNLYKRLA